MSGQVLGQIAGAIIGFAVGGPVGAAIGSTIGGSVGSTFDTLPTRYGPRLDDLRVQRSEYGEAIPLVYGTVGLQGNVIWATDIKEVKTETETGGKGGPSQTTVEYSYYGSFAIAICEGPITGVLRIWAGPDKRLIYDGVSIEGGTLRTYLGTETQLPDPLIEAHKGVGFTPAYRGTAYVVIEEFPLKNDGNRLPFLTFEVTTVDSGGTCSTDYTLVGEAMSPRALYASPPVKLGHFDDMSVPIYGRVTATDNDGNVYVVLASGANPVHWHIKRVSSTSPITEAMLDLDATFDGFFQCKIEYDPNANQLGVLKTGTGIFALVDCGTFAVVQTSTLAHNKTDLIYSVNEQQFRFLNYGPEYNGGMLDADSYGITHTYGAGYLVDCGPHGIAVALDTLLIPEATHTYLGGVPITNLCARVYDPIRDRLLALDGVYDRYTGYYDFATGATVVPVNRGTEPRFNAAYFPRIDRILCTSGGGITVINPADLTAESFPDECVLFNQPLVYADGVSPVLGGGIAFYPVALPNTRSKLVIVPQGAPADIFTFNFSSPGVGVTLASVVADLSERAGESRYDVSQLEDDIVDGYVIARQTAVRAAIDALRPAYYFDAVESHGLIKYVKRGGHSVTVISDGDLAAHDAGGDTPDPLKTGRRMEVELPRAVNVKYMLAADDYNWATKQARRLIGSSGDEQTIDVPLVMTDTKAQEVAEVNLHVSWAERLSYEFTLPRKYSHLEPTDLIVVKRHLMRLTKVTATPHGVLQCVAIADESAYYSPHVLVSETAPNEQTVSKPGVTLMELF